MGNFLSDCSGQMPLNGEVVEGEVKIVLRVDHALVHNTSGANISGFKVGDQIVICFLQKSGSPGKSIYDYSKGKGLDALSWRHRQNVRRAWPNSYRFQTPRENFFADVIDRTGAMTRCVVQVPVDPSERTMENAMIHVEDADLATTHASNFNAHMAQTAANMMDFHDPSEALPTVKICAPVATEVLASSCPELLPRGCACTITPYPHKEVCKFVFDGADEFMEVPQAFFHFAAYASGGLEFVCDIQGVEDDDGNYHLIDPVVLREDKASMTSFLNSTLREMKSDPSRRLGPDHAPTEALFDRLHPRCGQMCQSFDPGRRGAKGKKGFCGITCMT